MCCMMRSIDNGIACPKSDNASDLNVRAAVNEAGTRRRKRETARRQRRLKRLAGLTLRHQFPVVGRRSGGDVAAGGRGK